MFDDDNGFLFLSHITVSLRGISRDGLLRLLLVLFNNLDGTIGCSLHLHAVYLGSNSLDLWVKRLLDWWWWLGSLCGSIEVVLILSVASALC